MSEDKMLDGRRIMKLGKEDMIFTRDSFADDEGLALQLTQQFMYCWNQVTKGVNYQKDFDTYILKALMMHYERSHRIEKYDLDSDRVSSIACLVCEMKDTLFISQTKLFGF